MKIAQVVVVTCLTLALRFGCSNAQEALLDDESNSSNMTEDNMAEDDIDENVSSSHLSKESKQWKVQITYIEGAFNFIADGSSSPPVWLQRLACFRLVWLSWDFAGAGSVVAAYMTRTLRTLFVTGPSPWSGTSWHPSEVEFTLPISSQFPSLDYPNAMASAAS